MSDLPDIVEQNIRTRVLFRRGQKILVAVSGGADSMVLLQVLHRLSERNRWRIVVAHLNHGLRGRSSDADERLVLRAAKALGLPFVIGHANVKERMKSGRLSLEMAAREARHKFLARTAERLRISTIALAHHADDQVELFFVRLLRGAGSEGVGGMKWRNHSPFRPDGTRIELVRPLLDLPKESLRKYALEQKIKYREDVSNESLDILRNRIRHELLPLLRRKYQPAISKIILRLMELTEAEAQVTELLAQKWVGREAFALPKQFSQLPAAVQRRVIQLQLRRHDIPADFALVENLRTRSGQIISVSPKKTVLRDADGKLKVQELLSYGSNADQLEVDLQGHAGEAFFDRRRIKWQSNPQSSFRLPARKPGREVFDADRIGSRVILRHWRPGDRFQPIGMEKSMKLQDFFTNNRVPRAERHKLVVATTAKNEVFWVEGVRISERFKLRTNTKRQLTWQWKLL